MARAIVMLTDGNYINISADYIHWEKDFVSVWNGENCVAIIKVDFVNVAYLSEKGNGKQ